MTACINSKPLTMKQRDFDGIVCVGVVCVYFTRMATARRSTPCEFDFNCDEKGISVNLLPLLVTDPVEQQWMLNPFSLRRLFDQDADADADADETPVLLLPTKTTQKTMRIYFRLPSIFAHV